MNLEVGQTVKITNNEILAIMGAPVATGTVQSLHTDNKGFNFKCDQTKAIETVDFGDGQVEILD